MKWQQRNRLAGTGKGPTGKTLKPRNPHVAASRFRKAGAHGPGAGAARAKAMRETRNQVAELLSQGP